MVIKRKVVLTAMALLLFAAACFAFSYYCEHVWQQTSSQYGNIGKNDADKMRSSFVRTGPTSPWKSILTSSERNMTATIWKSEKDGELYIAAEIATARQEASYFIISDTHRSMDPITIVWSPAEGQRIWIFAQRKNGPIRVIGFYDAVLGLFIGEGAVTRMASKSLSGSADNSSSSAVLKIPNLPTGWEVYSKASEAEFVPER